MKKCMEYRVEGRRPVGRPRRTWLEIVEANMAELEIDREDVHGRKKWRNNVMKRKSNPIGKRTINDNIYIYIYIYIYNSVGVFANFQNLLMPLVYMDTVLLKVKGYCITKYIMYS